MEPSLAVQVLNNIRISVSDDTYNQMMAILFKIKFINPRTSETNLRDDRARVLHLFKDDCAMLLSLKRYFETSDAIDMLSAEISD